MITEFAISNIDKPETLDRFLTRGMVDYRKIPEPIIYQILARFTDWQVELLRSALEDVANDQYENLKEVVNLSIKRERCTLPEIEKAVNNKSLTQEKANIFYKVFWQEMESICVEVERIRQEIGICRDDMDECDNMDLPLDPYAV
jgi:hypothetical protein